MSWTQPMCRGCYAIKYSREPHAVSEDLRELEVCCLCARPTDEGVYVRLDPATVPHPTLREER